MGDPGWYSDTGEGEGGVRVGTMGRSGYKGQDEGVEWVQGAG